MTTEVRLRREIDVLRRLLLAMNRRELERVRETFAETPELFGEDQDAIDYVDWALKRLDFI